MSISSFENGTAQDSVVITGSLSVQSEPGQASLSKVSFDGGNFTTDGGGNVTCGNIAPALIVERASATALALATAGTIPVSNLGVSRVSPAGAVTGVIMQPGTASGQAITVVNESGNSITMAASGTSNVADGVSDVIAATTARRFVWDGYTSLWYRAA